MKLIHGSINPYKNFDYGKYDIDLQGWNGEAPIFREMIDKFEPRLIIEVGAWKGQSTINMARIIKEKGMDTKIITIDTWLGALEFWGNRRNQGGRELKLLNGYPQIYYQFLANVMWHKLNDIIIPFPITSIIAARFLRNAMVEAEMIYVDGSHDEVDVYMDLVYYGKLMSCDKRSVMFGDDYRIYNGIRNDLDKYCLENNCDFSLHYNRHFWSIER